jgi:hypothetical protein
MCFLETSGAKGPDIARVVVVYFSGVALISYQLKVPGTDVHQSHGIKKNPVCFVATKVEPHNVEIELDL